MPIAEAPKLADFRRNVHVGQYLVLRAGDTDAFAPSCKEPEQPTHCNATLQRALKKRTLLGRVFDVIVEHGAGLKCSKSEYHAPLVFTDFVLVRIRTGLNRLASQKLGPDADEVPEFIGQDVPSASQKTAGRKSMLEVAGIISGHHDCAETDPQKIRNFQCPLMTDGGMQLLTEAVFSHGSCKQSRKKFFCLLRAASYSCDEDGSALRHVFSLKVQQRLSRSCVGFCSIVVQLFEIKYDLGKVQLFSERER